MRLAIETFRGFNDEKEPLSALQSRNLHYKSPAGAPGRICTIRGDGIARYWPAKISSAEGLALSILLGLLGATAVMAFGSTSQLLTPIPWPLTAIATAGGAGAGFWCGRILARVNRAWNDRWTNYSSIFLTVVLYVVVANLATAQIVNRLSFRNGWTERVAYLPIQKITHDKHDYNHWIVLAEPGFVRPMFAISTLQFTVLESLCTGARRDCSGSGFCVLLRTQHSSGGAIRILVTDASDPPPRITVRRCDRSKPAIRIEGGS